MNFESAKWDDDTVGDQLHSELFHKTKKKPKSKAKTKKITKQAVQNIPEKKESNLNISLLSKNITQKLQTLLTHPTEEKNENVEQHKTPVPKPKKIIRKRIKLVPKIRPTQNILKKQSPKLKKKLKRLETKSETNSAPKVVRTVSQIQKLTGLNIANLKKRLAQSLEVGEKDDLSLRDRMLDKLSAARFRFLNEQMYTVDGAEAQKLFKEDPDAFQAYHSGYRHQVEKWPLNPLDTIISSIKSMPESHVVGDFGCGDAKLSQSVSQKVHSFDLIAANENVVACEMSKVPLKNNSLDVAVYCLSLMGTNLKDYLFEANRVLKIGGVLKIAEVESRFGEEGVELFIKGVTKFGFKKTWEDLSHNLFYFIDFVKERNLKQKNKLPTISLKPCLYKKR